MIFKDNFSSGVPKYWVLGILIGNYMTLLLFFPSHFSIPGIDLLFLKFLNSWQCPLHDSAL